MRPERSHPSHDKTFQVFIDANGLVELLDRAAGLQHALELFICDGVRVVEDGYCSFKPILKCVAHTLGSCKAIFGRSGAITALLSAWTLLL